MWAPLGEGGSRACWALGRCHCTTRGPTCALVIFSSLPMECPCFIPFASPNRNLLAQWLYQPFTHTVS
jgi:hypothetical protein